MAQSTWHKSQILFVVSAKVPAGHAFTLIKDIFKMKTKLRIAFSTVA